MARKPARAPSNGRRPNDDIGEEMRLKLYHSQFRLRQAEQRAYDLFLANLVKGTSHLSLGQEAIAAGFGCAMKKGDHTFCTYRGHAHTLARGVPVEKVLGELMQRDNGLMRGKGGSIDRKSTRLNSSHLGISYAVFCLKKKKKKNKQNVTVEHIQRTTARDERSRRAIEQ